MSPTAPKPTSHVRAAPLPPRSTTRTHFDGAARVAVNGALRVAGRGKYAGEERERGRRGYAEVREKRRGLWGGGGGARRGTVTAACALMGGAGRGGRGAFKA